MMAYSYAQRLAQHSVALGAEEHGLMLGLPTGNLDGSRIHSGLLWVPTAFSNMKKTGVTYRAYATNW